MKKLFQKSVEPPVKSAYFHTRNRVVSGRIRPSPPNPDAGTSCKKTQCMNWDQCSFGNLKPQLKGAATDPLMERFAHEQQPRLPLAAADVRRLWRRENRPPSPPQWRWLPRGQLSSRHRKQGSDR